MLGQWTTTKPSRSDEVLDADQQRKITNEIRAQFDSLAPKRHTKPNRSEPDSTTAVSATDQNIPEFDKLRSLQSQSYVIYSGKGANTVPDDFVETQYYKELLSIDKQHHKTGSGFIRLMNEGGEENGFHFEIENGHPHSPWNRPAFKSNPATNEWVPSVDQEDQAFVSSKPNRSEGS